mmetsp:Transcript_4722/g.11244  ORF Transcript_4722/g.11244 Transcript_4722/m.11244 type:complete len:220 (-) Transcript_4722:253-912(-)
MALAASRFCCCWASRADRNWRQMASMSPVSDDTCAARWNSLRSLLALASVTLLATLSVGSKGSSTHMTALCLCLKTVLSAALTRPSRTETHSLQRFTSSAMKRKKLMRSSCTVAALGAPKPCRKDTSAPDSVSHPWYLISMPFTLAEAGGRACVTLLWVREGAWRHGRTGGLRVWRNWMTSMVYAKLLSVCDVASLMLRAFAQALTRDRSSANLVSMDT